MKIAKNKVVSINYTLKDDSGAVLDSSAGKAPLAYLHGNKNLIDGMEKSLEGKEAGAKFNITIAPEEAYGVKSPDLINDVPLANFPEKEFVKIGANFQADTDEGMRVATVTNIKGDVVTVDFNHPLAGKTLFFDIEVVSVREATKDELAHGHVHGDGCHHH